MCSFTCIKDKFLPKKKKKKFPIWKLFAIIGAVVTFAAAGYVVFTKFFKKKDAPVLDVEDEAEDILAEEDAEVVEEATEDTEEKND